MKRVVALVVISIILIAGCNRSSDYILDDKFRTDEYIPGFDAQDEYTESYRSIVQKDGIYYMILNRFLLYYDEETGMSGHLCGRPECMHEDGNCNAYLHQVSNIQLYDDHIYWIDNDGGVLYRVDMTGNNREVVQYVQGGAWNEFVIHRGYLYVQSSENVVMNKKNHITLTVRQYKLGKKDPEEKILFENSFEGRVMYTCRFYRNNIYLILNHNYAGDELSYERKILCYDIATDKWSELISEESTYSIRSAIVNEKGIHMMEVMIDETEERRVRKSFFSFENNDKLEIEDILYEMESVNVAIWENYYMLYSGLHREESKYQIYDWDGNLVREEIIQDGSLTYYGKDEKGVLFWQYYSDGYGSYDEISSFSRLMRIPLSSNEPVEFLMDYVRPVGSIYGIQPVEK